MRRPKGLLLAGIAFALVLGVGPAAASALTLKDAGKEVSNREIELTGSIGFNTLVGGLSCSATMRLTVNGKFVQVPSLTVSTIACGGSGGLSGCRVTGDQVLNLPWSVSVSASSLSIHVVEISFTLSPLTGKTCSPKNFTVSFASIAATPDSTTSIHSVTLSGEGAGTIEGVPLEVEAEGSLEVSLFDSGTYGIG